MGAFYVDESIHDAHGFIIVAIVYSDENLDPIIRKIIKKSRLEEYKSSHAMKGNTAYQNLRDELLWNLRTKYRLGVAILPARERKSIYYEAMLCIKKIITENNLQSSHKVFFDEGISAEKVPFSKTKNTVRIKHVDEQCEIYMNQDSKKVEGIQLADLMAHYCAILFKTRTGILNKTVEVDPKASGYIEPIPLGLEIFASIRHKFFCKPDEHTLDIEDKGNFLLHQSTGLHISAKCDENLSRSAINVFGRVYLGCIH